MTTPTLLPEPTDERAGRRRTFTAETKARVLTECDTALANDGSIGQILRREGLYSSHLHDWRPAREEGGEAALARKRGRPPPDPGFKAQRKEIERLQRENAALKGRLRRQDITLDAPKVVGGAAGAAGRPDERERRMSALAEIAPEAGLAVAFEALGVSRATLSRRQAPKPPAHPLPDHPRALSTAERQVLHELRHSPRYMDMAPRQVHATLLDELACFCSVSTMYRGLRRAARVRERRALRRHPSYARPELMARAPNEVWSWDITKVRGPGRRDWLHL